MFSCCSILIEVINFSNAFSCSLILAPHEFACKPNLSLHNLTAISEWALPYWKVTKYNHRKEPNECHLKQNHIEQKCSKIDKYHFKRNNHEKKVTTSNPLLHIVFVSTILISTEGAFRRLLTNDEHPSPPIQSTFCSPSP